MNNWRQSVLEVTLRGRLYTALCNFATSSIEELHTHIERYSSIPAPTVHGYGMPSSVSSKAQFVEYSPLHKPTIADVSHMLS